MAYWLNTKKLSLTKQAIQYTIGIKLKQAIQYTVYNRDKVKTGYTVYNRDKVKTKNINIDVGKTDQNIIQKYDI